MTTATRRTMPDTAKLPASASDTDQLLLMTSRADNFRLKDRIDTAEDEDEDDDEDGELLKSAVPSSSEIKLLAEQVIARHAKAKKRKGKGKLPDAVEDTEELASF